MPAPIVQTVRRTQGDTRSPLLARLMQGTVPANLANCTVTFTMINADDKTVVCDNVSAEIVDETTGTVQYYFQPADVATAGTFAFWFVAIEVGKTDHFPCSGETAQLLLSPRYGS